MYKTSEWVSLGHPDKTADYLSCFILDRFLDAAGCGNAPEVG